MNIDDLTFGQIKEIAGMFPESSTNTTNDLQPYEIGKAYIIRTVTYMNIGTVVQVGGQEIVLEDASWIPDSGRWADALRDGTLQEVEPYPSGRVIVGRGAVVDAAVWNHPVPRDQQ